MSFKCGIVGLPNVGKSTLFNALIQSRKARAANFPFCTIDPNIGSVLVPDERLNIISNISQSKKIINAVISFYFFLIFFELTLSLPKAFLFQQFLYL